MPQEHRRKSLIRGTHASPLKPVKHVPEKLSAYFTQWQKQHTLISYRILNPTSKTDAGWQAIDRHLLWQPLAQKSPLKPVSNGGSDQSHQPTSSLPVPRGAASTWASLWKKEHPADLLLICKCRVGLRGSWSTKEPFQENLFPLAIHKNKPLLTKERQKHPLSLPNKIIMRGMFSPSSCNWVACCRSWPHFVTTPWSSLGRGCAGGWPSVSFHFCWWCDAVQWF